MSFEAKEADRGISRKRFVQIAIAIGGSAALSLMPDNSSQGIPSQSPSRLSNANLNQERASDKKIGIWVLHNASTEFTSKEENVLDERGRFVGKILEVPVVVQKGDRSAKISFSFYSGDDEFDVITEGAQSWSTSTSDKRIPSFLLKDGLVGRRSFSAALGGRTYPLYEPGPGNERVPKNEGRSYGWITFRNLETGRNTSLGVIPNFRELHDLRFRRVSGEISVDLRKNLEGVNFNGATTFKVFLAENNPRESSNGAKYSDLVFAYDKTLAQLRGERPLMKNRIIGFSWPSLGQGVTQETVTREVKAGRGRYDTYVIDDGWESFRGSWGFDRKKFPDIKGLVQEMKASGIKPGIWIAPFIADKQIKDIPSKWYMKDSQGEDLKVPVELTVKEGGLSSLAQRPYAYDISNPKFRKYLVSKFVDLTRLGFEVFKLDFLYTPFVGELQNKDKTSVEYYRQTFEEIRAGIRKELGKEVEFIGCGAPTLESIGLFEGFRFTWDTAYPNIKPVGARFTPIGKAVVGSSLARRGMSYINTGLYRDVVAVGSKRILMYKDALGLIWDGVHLNDDEIPLEPQHRDRTNKVLLALAQSLGGNNIFVGDGLAGLDERKQKAWDNFIANFK